MDTSPEISWSRLAAFVRQHTHDMRNHLNGLDLEAALLTELVGENQEAKSSVARLRRQIRDISGELRSMSGKFAPSPAAKSPITVRDLIMIWKDQASTVDPAPRVEWQEAVGDARVSVDLDALARSFRELFENAVAFGTGEVLQAEAGLRKGRVVFQLTEPKAETVDCANWGSTPLQSTRRGSYGLGLWVLQGDVAASSGDVERHYDAQARTLTTTLSFPSI